MAVAKGYCWPRCAKNAYIIATPLTADYPYLAHVLVCFHHLREVVLRSINGNAEGRQLGAPNVNSFQGLFVAGLLQQFFDEKRSGAT